MKVAVDKKLAITELSELGFSISEELQQEYKDVISNVGGIDLNEIDLDRRGVSVDIQFDPIQFQEMIDMGLTGFAPVIINFTPLPSVLPLLGLSPNKEEEYELSSLN